MTYVVRPVRDLLRQSDLDRALRLLSNGEVLLAPTDTVYGLFARGLDLTTMRKLDHIKGGRRSPYALLFDHWESVEHIIGEVDLRRKRVVKTLLPGPVTLILPDASPEREEFRRGSSGLGVRISADPLIPRLVEELGTPLWGTSANRTGGMDPVDFNAVEPSILESVAMAFDLGPTLYREHSTIIDLTRFPYSVVRPGAWLTRCQEALKAAAEPIIVEIICSGNICRSPIAQAILQNELGQPENSGVIVRSSGLDALDGEPASSPMVQIGLDNNINLSYHRSTRTELRDLDQCDLILTVTPTHRDRLLALNSELTNKVRLLGEPIGVEAIPDPYGYDREEYLKVFHIINEACHQWAEILRPATLNYTESYKQ